jgi:hypothetical protein
MKGPGEKIKVWISLPVTGYTKFRKSLDKSYGNLLRVIQYREKGIEVQKIFGIKQGNWWWWANIEREACPVLL